MFQYHIILFINAKPFTACYITKSTYTLGEHLIQRQVKSANDIQEKDPYS